MSSPLVAEGLAALRDGDAEVARAAFESAVAEAESGIALEGLGEAVYLQCEYPTAAVHYERAYAAYRREGAHAAAGRAARTVAWITGNVLGDWAVRSGWLARARTVHEESGGDQPDGGWVLIIRAFLEPDAQLREAMLREAIAIGRRFDDADITALVQPDRADRRTGAASGGRCVRAVGDRMGPDGLRPAHREVHPRLVRNARGQQAGWRQPAAAHRAQPAHRPRGRLRSRRARRDLGPGGTCVGAAAAAAHPVVGVRALDQVHDIMGCVDVELSADQLARLDEASRIELGFPYDFLREPQGQLVYGDLESRIETPAAWPRSA